MWATTAFLWSVWLQNDMSNIAIYLPRSIPGGMFVFCLICFLVIQAYILYKRGDKVQGIINEKYKMNDTRYVCIINILYGGILFTLKTFSKIPMSSTWLFVGLLAGKEISTSFNSIGISKRKAILLSAKDLFKVTFGFVVSLLLGMAANPLVYEGIMEAFGGKSS